MLLCDIFFVAAGICQQPPPQHKAVTDVFISATSTTADIAAADDPTVRWRMTDGGGGGYAAVAVAVSRACF